MIKNIFLVFLLITLSCSKKKDLKIQEKSKTIVFFDPITLGSSGVDAGLKINARFSECGEWGGHHDSIKIFAKEGNYKDCFLNYVSTNIDCEKRDNKGRNIETIVIQKTIKLTDSNKKSIIEYMKRMIESKAGERFPGHAGNSFSIINSDSTFIIKVYDFNSKNLKSYNQLLSELRLSKK